MFQKVIKTGTGLAIEIPKVAIEGMGIAEGADVRVFYKLESKRLVLVIESGNQPEDIKEARGSVKGVDTHIDRGQDRY